MTKTEKIIGLLICRDISLKEFPQDQTKEWGNIVCNFTMNELLSMLHERKLEVAELAPVSMQHLANVGRDICWLRFMKAITAQEGKEILGRCFDHECDVFCSMEALKLFDEMATDELDAIIVQTIQEQGQAAEDYQAGKAASLGFLIGAVIKKVGKKATPQDIKEKLKKVLDKKEDPAYK